MGRTVLFDVIEMTERFGGFEEAVIVNCVIYGIATNIN